MESRFSRHASNHVQHHQPQEHYPVIELQRYHSGMPNAGDTLHDGNVAHRDAMSSAEPAQSFELKPVDGGRDAWQLLIAAFVFEALFWGFPTSYGIFQAYYSRLPQFSSNTGNIAVIGTLAQGLAYLGAPFSAALTKRFPRHQKTQLWLGWVLCITGLLTASFATTVPTLILTQGMTYGTGFIILTYPILNMVNEWWIVRKGMAFGLISAASGLTGIFMPLLLEALLDKWGYQITLRACAVAMVVLTAPLIPLLRGRLPLPASTVSMAQNTTSASSSSIIPQPSITATTTSPTPSVEPHNQRNRTNWSFLRKPRFYAYALAMTTQGFGFFIPPIFISSYAISLGLTATKSAALLAVMSLFQTLGQFAFGWLSDLNHGQRFPVSLLASTCCVVAGLATFTLWGFGKSFAILILYVMVYGFFAFAFGTLRVAMGRAVTTEQSAVLATYSTFVFLQGFGNVLVGPVVAGLMSSSDSSSPSLSSSSTTTTVTFIPSDYGGARYKETIIFVASSSLLGAFFMVAPTAFRRITSLLN